MLVKAARWRANTFNYGRWNGSRFQPGISLRRSQAIEQGLKPLETVLSCRPRNQSNNENQSYQYLLAWQNINAQKEEEACNEQASISFEDGIMSNEARTIGMQTHA
jgi:hypothetical protein